MVQLHLCSWCYRWATHSVSPPLISAAAEEGVPTHNTSFPSQKSAAHSLESPPHCFPGSSRSLHLECGTINALEGNTQVTRVWSQQINVLTFRKALHTRPWRASLAHNGYQLDDSSLLAFLLSLSCSPCSFTLTSWNCLPNKWPCPGSALGGVQKWQSFTPLFRNY